MTDDTMPMPFIDDDEPPWLVNRRDDVWIPYPTEPTESAPRSAIAQSVVSAAARLLGGLNSPSGKHRA